MPTRPIPRAREHLFQRVGFSIALMSWSQRCVFGGDCARLWWCLMPCSCVSGGGKPHGGCGAWSPRKNGLGLGIRGRKGMSSPCVPHKRLQRVPWIDKALHALHVVWYHSRYPPPSLYKLRPCPSYSGFRDCNHLGPNLIRYQMWCSHMRHGFGHKGMGLVTNLPAT